MKTLSTLVALVVALAGAACSDTVAPTTPSTAPSTATEVYTGTMTPGGSGFFAFRVTSPGSVSITLASLTASSTGTTLASALQIGIGVPAGEICEVAASVTAAPSLTAQLTRAVSADVYCVRLSDLGSNLTVPASFGVRVVHP
jgi:hypothetical protein